MNRYFVGFLDYSKHIKPVLSVLKKWPRMEIGNITKYEPVLKGIKWFGMYKGHSIKDIVALASIEYDLKNKTIDLRQLNAGEKGIGRILMNNVIDWCKQNKNGCHELTWVANPDGGEELKNYYRKNWPEAKETEEKNPYWKTSRFTIKL